MNEQEDGERNKNPEEENATEQPESSKGRVLPKLSLKTIRRALSREKLGGKSPSEVPNPTFFPPGLSPTTPSSSNLPNIYWPAVPKAPNLYAKKLKTEVVDALNKGLRIGGGWGDTKLDEVIRDLESFQHQMMQFKLDRKVILSSDAHDNINSVEEILLALKRTRDEREPSTDISYNERMDAILGALGEEPRRHDEPSDTLVQSTSNVTDVSESAGYDADADAVETVITDFLEFWKVGQRQAFARSGYEPSADEFQKMQDTLLVHTKSRPDDPSASTDNPIARIQKLTEFASIEDVIKIVGDVKIGEHQSGEGKAVNVFNSAVLIQTNTPDDAEEKPVFAWVPHELVLGHEPQIGKLVSFCSPVVFQTKQQFEENFPDGIPNDFTVDDILDLDLKGVIVRNAGEREAGSGDVVVANGNSALLLMKPRSPNEKPHLINVARELIEKNVQIEVGMPISFRSAIDYTIARLERFPETASIDDINSALNGKLGVQEVEGGEIGKGAVVKILSNSVVLQMDQPYRAEGKPTLRSVASIRVLGTQELGKDVSFCSVIVANTIEQFEAFPSSATVQEIAEKSAIKIFKPAEDGHGAGVLVKVCEDSVLLLVEKGRASKDLVVLNVPRAHLKDDQPVIRKRVSFYSAKEIKDVVSLSVRKALLDIALDAQEELLEENTNLKALKPRLMGTTEELISAMEAVSLPAAQPNTDKLFELISLMSKIGQNAEPVVPDEHRGILTQESQTLLTWVQSFPTQSANKKTLEAQCESLLNYETSVVQVSQGRKLLERSAMRLSAAQSVLDESNGEATVKRFLESMEAKGLTTTKPNTDKLFELISEISETTEPDILSEKGKALTADCDALLEWANALPDDASHRRYKGVLEEQSQHLLKYAQSVVGVAESKKALAQSTAHFNAAQRVINDLNDNELPFRALIEEAAPTKPRTDALAQLVSKIMSSEDMDITPETGQKLVSECERLVSWADAIPLSMEYDKKALKKQAVSLRGMAEGVVGLPEKFTAMRQSKEWAESVKHVLETFDRDPSLEPFRALLKLAKKQPLDADTVGVIKDHIEQNRDTFTVSSAQSQRSSTRLIMHAAITDKLLESHYKGTRDQKTAAILRGINKDDDVKAQLEAKIDEAFKRRLSGSSAIFYTREDAKTRIGWMVQQELLPAATLTPPPGKKLKDKLDQAMTLASSVHETHVFGHECSGQIFVGTVEDPKYRNGDELESLSARQKVTASQHSLHHLNPLEVKFVDAKGNAVKLERGQKFVFSLPAKLHLIKEAKLYECCTVTPADEYFSKNKKISELKGTVCHIANGSGPARKGTLYFELPPEGAQVPKRHVVVCPPEKGQRYTVGDQVTCTSLAASTGQDVSKKKGQKM
ncbi:MAG: hypothetical protein V4568_10550 [Pseudomonadota bacterium]